MLYNAANQPGTVPDLVAERIAAETQQVETLFGFEFMLRGEPIAPNAIDNLLRTSDNPTERRAVWEASKEVGPTLKPGLTELRRLRNETVQALGSQD
jgi:peptidyl-dipeptidase A